MVKKGCDQRAQVGLVLEALEVPSLADQVDSDFRSAFQVIILL